MLTGRTNGWRDLVIGVHEGSDGVFPGRARYASGGYTIDWAEYEATKHQPIPKDAVTIFTDYGDKPLCQAQVSSL